MIALLLTGQFLHALLRTGAIQATAQGRPSLTVSLNVAANLVRLLVLAGGVEAVSSRSWGEVTALLIGQASGDLLSMHLGRKAQPSDGEG